MLTDPSKGGSSLAQAFAQNKATQPTQALPTIQQPQAQPLPQISAPKRQRAAPAMPSNDKPNYLHVFGLGSGEGGTPVSVHNAPGQWVRQKTPNGWDWVKADQGAQVGDVTQMFGGRSFARPSNEREATLVERLNWLSGGQGGGSQQPVMGSMAPSPKFPSQAQLLARAINERAQGGG